MSSRRSRSRQTGAGAGAGAGAGTGTGGSRNNISEDQINELVTKLQELLPELRHRRSDRVPAARVLQETCNYIRNLHREVDDLSERLSELLANTDGPQAAMIRSLLMQ